MKRQDLYALFIDELEDMLNAENLLVEALPRLVQLATRKDLKDALLHHLHETREQVSRIEQVFALLDLKPKQKNCKAMQGLLKEADDIVQHKIKSLVLDAAIISAAQKVEHYEIASYGTLHSFAKKLELGTEIEKLLQASLDEEAAADKLLTKIAEGSFFTAGVNELASQVEFSASGKSIKK